MTRTTETEAEGHGCWTIDYWLRCCEGFRVCAATGPIGYVEAVLTTADDEPHSLVVRVGSSVSVPVTVPIEAIESLDPATERVIVASAFRSDEHADRQLKIPALT
jgi:hypothetical protein